MKPAVSAAEAVASIRSGQRVFIHSSAATPHVLLDALLARAGELTDMELVSISTYGDMGLDRPGVSDHFFLNSLFTSGNVRKTVNSSAGDHVPIFLSEIPRLFDRGMFPLDAALVQLSPPDRHGFCTLGVSVDVSRAAVRNARLVIGQINPRMPRTHGEGQVHISQLHACVEVDEPLPEVDYACRIGDRERAIGHHCAALVEDGSTLQLGIGAQLALRHGLQHRVVGRLHGGLQRGQPLVKAAGVLRQVEHH